MGDTSGIWWQKPLMLKKSFTFNNEVFEFAEYLFYNLRTGEISKKKRQKKKTNNYGRESTSVIGATLWDLVPIELKNRVLPTMSKQKQITGFRRSALAVSVKLTFNMLAIYKNILLLKLFRNHSIVPLFYYRCVYWNKKINF